MRIITGKYKGRHFDIPRTFKARPTTDFAKENIFNVLVQYVDFDCAEALDLFSGTGSISLELVSRGCSHVVSVELDRDHHRFIQDCMKKLNDQTCISIRGDENAKMGILNDVKDVLRSIGQLKIQYTAPKESAVTRRLPPVGVGGTVTPSEALQSVDRNNVFVVRVNSADKVFAGNAVSASDADLLARSKEFIRERAPRAIISLGMDYGSSYLKFYSVQKLLKQAFDEVRDEQARSLYGKALAELTPEELEDIQMAVPLNITEMELRNNPQPRVR